MRTSAARACPDSWCRRGAASECLLTLASLRKQCVGRVRMCLLDRTDERLIVVCRLAGFLPPAARRHAHSQPLLLGHHTPFLPPLCLFSRLLITRMF